MQLTEWVPWLVSAMAVPQTLLMRYKRRSAWLWCALGCAVCGVYSWVTAQYGFVPVNVFFLGANLWNYAKWKRDDIEAAERMQQGAGSG